MTPPSPFHRLARLGLVASALASAACTSDDAVDIDVGPTGDPTLAIAEPLSVDGAPVCASIGTDPDFRMPFYVSVQQLLLRPPGACGAYAQCGELALYVDGVLNDLSSVPAIDLLFRRLADRYHDGSPHAASGEPDVLRVRIAAVDADLEPLLDHAGEPLSDELEVTSFVTCPEP
ncbi:MAG: hypothetical protein IT373_22805 [Polyangiaceae bacterium]|nr:hypothetical protein [Polyangiaceae bacterium]